MEENGEREEGIKHKIDRRGREKSRQKIGEEYIGSERRREGRTTKSRTEKKKRYGSADFGKK